MAKWNTLNYLKWHIPKKYHCTDCKIESVYVCDSCKHWADLHDGVCGYIGCLCEALGKKRGTKLKRKDPNRLQF